MAALIKIMTGTNRTNALPAEITATRIVLSIIPVISMVNLAFGSIRNLLR